MRRNNRHKRVNKAVEFSIHELERRLLCCIDHNGHYTPSLPIYDSTIDFSGKPGAVYAPLGSVPVLSSNPSASATLYLDFDGAPTQAWGSYTATATPAYSMDGDTGSLSVQELAAIQQIYTRVAEAYSPFDINVTTVDPGNRTDGLTVAVVIGGGGAWLGASAGGVAYVGSFYNTAPNTCWVFSNNLATGHAKYVADAAVHESGHTFGLYHQSSYSGTTRTAEYRAGVNGIGTFMGNSYSSSRVLWSNGQSSRGYNQYQDDLAILANQTNGFGYRDDDHGNAIGDATALTLSGADVSGSGILTATADVDVFSFVTSAGNVSFTLNVAQYGAMLNATFKLIDTNGTAIVTADTSSLGETINATLAGGAYRLIVSSKGGYSEVGSYTISGTIVPDENYVAAPSNLVGVSGADGVTLTWYDNPWNETGFAIQRSDDGGATWNTLDTLADGIDEYLDATAVVGTSLRYRVYAFNDINQSGNSNTITVAVTPAIPSDLALTTVSSVRIDIAWTDVTGETGYILERATDRTGWVQVAVLGADVTSWSDTALAAATRYYYRVKATSGVGNSATAASVNAFTMTAAPNLTVVAFSDTRINLSWNNVVGETGYRVERSTDGNTWTVLATTALNVITFGSTALSAGTQYFYRVSALNAGGASTSATKTTTTLLPAPTGIDATTSTTSQIDVAWNDSTGETGYRVERSADLRTWTIVANLAADVISWSDTGLLGGSFRAYRVRALNAGGVSAPSSYDSVTTVPVAPTLSGGAVSGTQINLSWTNVSGETGYVLEQSADGNTWTQIATPALNAIAYQNTGLVEDTDYLYRIKAVNAAGDSAYSATITRRTLMPVPTGFSTTVISTSQVDIAWDDSTNETGYRIERSFNGTTWITLANLSADDIDYSDTTLLPGATAFYRLRALNSAGASLPTASSRIVTIPAAPALVARATSTSAIALSWTNVNGETGYRLEKSTDGNTWTLLANKLANVITHSDVGLSTDTVYHYRVTAINGSGESATTTVNKRTLLPAPTTVSAQAISIAQITLTWDESSTAAGYTIERFNGRTWQVIATTSGASSTTFTNSGLLKGKLYSYRVRAANSGGDSAPSTIASATTPLI